MRIATIISLFMIFIVLIVEINGQTRRTTKKPGGRTTKKSAGRNQKKPVATKKPQNRGTTKKSGGRSTTMDPAFLRGVIPVSAPVNLDLYPETTTFDWTNENLEEYGEYPGFSLPEMIEESKPSKTNTRKGKYKSRGRKEKNQSFEEEYEYTNTTHY